MKLNALLEFVSKATADDLDQFFASPRMNLKASSIDELRKTFPSTEPVKVYRVLFSDDEEETAKLLNVKRLEVGNAIHKADRVSSWSTSKKAVEEMAEENDDLGHMYVILEATIPAKAIVLNTTTLSDAALMALRDNNKMLVRIVRDQKEVMVAAGTYPCRIISVVYY